MNRALVSVENLRANYHMGWIDRLPLVQKPFNKTMDWMLGLGRINDLITRLRDRYNHDFVAALLEDMGISLILSEQDRLRIPQTGRAVVACNHPTGILEIAVLHALLAVREDVRIVINTTLLDITRNAQDLTIPVPIFRKGDTAQREETKKRIQQALDQEMLLLFFPSGVVSNKLVRGHMEDARWKKGFVYSAVQNHAPVIPAFVTATNSDVFYRIRRMGALGETLSSLLLFREFIRQRGSEYEVRIGEPMWLHEHHNLESDPADADAMAEQVRRQAHALRYRVPQHEDL